MSAMACFTAEKGHAVTGSDRSLDNNPSHPLYKNFGAKGITIVPQNGNGIDSSFDFAVFSTAVEQDTPEFIKAISTGIPVKTRPGYLAEISADFRTIAVAGTSGKSTAAGMIAFLMNRLELKPNFIGGGRVKQFKTETQPGNFLSGGSDILIIEACESDNAITKYEPGCLILLNLQFDHHSIETTTELFKRVIDSTKELIVTNTDDLNLRKIMKKDSITFSIDSPSKYRATDISFEPFSTKFSLNGIHFSLNLPGKYNLYNALSCLALLSEKGIPLESTAGILQDFEGIERRFDVHLNNGKYLVIDDYAHNPHKISSLMTVMKNIRKRICYIFQPHGYGPTRMMKNEYIDALVQNLDNSDHLILLPIFYAGGTARRDISSHDLADEIRDKGKSVQVIEDRKKILEMLHRWDTYVIFGARDETLSDFAAAIAYALPHRE